MRRKIVKQGTATLTMSLPAKWTRENKLKAGDEIDLVEQNGELLISASTIKQEQAITYRMTENNKHNIRHILTHLYRIGYDVIKLTGVDDKLFGKIRRLMTDLLLGFEITDSVENSCTLTNISEPTDEKFDVLMRRTFLLIKETQAFMNEDYDKGKFEHMNEMDALRDQQDKFIIFCRRVLNSSCTRTGKMYWELFTFLMHIQHCYYYMYKYASEKRPKKNAKVVRMLIELKKYFELFYGAFYGKDIKKIERMNKLSSKYQFGECYKELEKLTGPNTVMMSHIREIFRWMQLGTSPIMNLSFQEE
jgi:phosphate uptake regulator